MKTTLYILIFLFTISATMAAECGGDIQCACGDTLVESHVMWYDLECDSNGLRIGSDNLELNCDGHSISRNSRQYVGIQLQDKDGISIHNCIISHFRLGVDASNTNGTNITNNTFNNGGMSAFNGVNVVDSVISNNVIFDAGIGLSLRESEGNLVRDNLFVGTYTGIQLYQARENSVTNNLFMETIIHDINLAGEHDMVCKNIVENNVGTGGNLIRFVTGAEHLDHGTYSLLILCQADGAIIENVIVNSGEASANGIVVTHSEDVLIDNVVSSGNREGIRLHRGTTSTVRHSNFSNNQDGVLLRSNGNNIHDNTIMDNSNNDIQASGNYCENTVADNTGTGGLPIEFANEESHYIGGHFAELILCNAPDSTVRDVTIGGFGNNLFGVFHSPNTLIEGVVSSENIYGLLMEHSDESIITDSTFDSNEHVGLHFHSNEQSLIQGNSLDSNQHFGIVIRNSQHSRLIDNTITNTAWDALVISTFGEDSFIEVAKNRIIGGVRGISLDNVRRVSIHDNEVQDSNDCITLEESHTNTIEANNIHDCGKGMFLQDSYQNTVIENRLEDNMYGIQSQAEEGEGNMFFRNWFYNENSALDSGPCTNQWDDGTIGNYWDDFMENPGYPTHYEISGECESIDNHPIWIHDSVAREKRSKSASRVAGSTSVHPTPGSPVDQPLVDSARPVVLKNK